MVEACIALRRKLGSSKRSFVRKLRSKPSIQFVLSILLFGVNLGLGYMAMLVAMTYSLELFMCIVLGIMIGHAIFNMKQPVGESIDPCCAPSQNDETKPSEITDTHDGRQTVMRRESFTSYTGSYGMGDVTRTPCDASIDIEDHGDAIENQIENHQNPSQKKEGGCCHSKKNENFTNTSEYQDKSQNIDYQRPPPYYSEESSSNSEDRSDGDSGVSNTKYANKDSEELGIMMSSFRGNEKLVTTSF